MIEISIIHCNDKNIALTFIVAFFDLGYNKENDWETINMIADKLNKLLYL